MTFWVTLDKPVMYRGAMRQSFSVDGANKTEAQAVATRELIAYGINSGAITSVQSLPYPAEPRLGYKDGDCPSFCTSPTRCAGHTSCPRSISCTD